MASRRLSAYTYLPNAAGISVTNPKSDFGNQKPKFKKKPVLLQAFKKILG